MTTVKSYANAPIVEAILDIQVDTPDGLTLSSLAECQHKVKKEYPSRADESSHFGEWTFGEKQTSLISSAVTGYVFSTADRKQMFQVKKTGFTFNRLSPYVGWELFFTEAQRLWEEYRRVARPRAYRRIALRYLNRFNFTRAEVRIEDYFRTYIEVSRDLPQVMGGFVCQVRIPLQDINAVANITQAPVMADGQIIPAILLDIDVFRVDSLPSGSELWPLFEQLRVAKNNIFEACITDKARELIR